MLSSFLLMLGVTPYLPVNLAPEVETEIERVLVLGDKPILSRPIPAAVVLEALPKACARDPVLCRRVQRYLRTYMKGSGIEYAGIEADATTGLNPILPNQHGRRADSHFELAAGGYWQPGSYLLVNLGGVAYQGAATPTGSLLSLGFDWAQLDIGYRDHWWSPMTDSSMLLSTEARTMPSITLSNYEPLTRLGFQYELMVARLSKSNAIELPVTGQTTTGYPKVAGLRLAIQPVAGWALSANRILIFGGTPQGTSAGSLLQAFFNPSKAQTTGFGSAQVVGKQEASVTSRFIFPGRIPFSIYFEYAGNDTDAGRNYLLGKPDLSMGLHIPKLGPVDLTLENSYWAPTWYVHGYSDQQIGYGDGITNYRVSFGNWFGDQRTFGNSPGGHSSSLRVGWEPGFAGRMELVLRTLVNDNYQALTALNGGFYSPVPYRHEYMGTLSYSRPWKEAVVGTQINAGRDVFGHGYSGLGVYLRYGDALHEGDEGDQAVVAEGTSAAELFVDAGANANRVQVSLNGLLPRYVEGTEVAPHVAFGARRSVSTHQDLGVRIEADELAHRAFYNVRLLDYRYRFGTPLALEFFAGAARYNLSTPAYGFTFGAGVQWRDVVPKWDVGLDYLYGVNVARIRLLPQDVQEGTRNDSFYNIQRATLYLSRKF